MIVAAALLVTFFIADGRREAAPRRVAYSEILAAVDRNEVTEVRVAERELVATLAGPARGEPLRIAATRLPGIDESQLVTRLEQHNVKFSGTLPATPAAYLPLLFVGGLCLLAAGRFPMLRPRSYDSGKGGVSWRKVPILAKKRRSRSKTRRSRFRWGTGKSACPPH